MTVPLRLSKYLSQWLPCSRREAELYIEGGWVRVDGRIEERPQCLIDGQQVSLDPQAKPTPIAPASFILHQPEPVASAPGQILLPPEQRWSGDHSRIRPLLRHQQRLQDPLALPSMACGLVVLSQDPRIVRKLQDTQQPPEQEYLVEFSGQLDPQGLALLNHGLKIQHYPLPPIKVSRQSEQRLRFAFKRLQPDRIPAMCQAVGIQALNIKRMRIGRQSLAGLPAGQWRYLAPYERF